MDYIFLLGYIECNQERPVITHLNQCLGSTCECESCICRSFLTIIISMWKIFYMVSYISGIYYHLNMKKREKMHESKHLSKEKSKSKRCEQNSKLNN